MMSFSGSRIAPDDRANWAARLAASGFGQAQAERIISLAEATLPPYMTGEEMDQSIRDYAAEHRLFGTLKRWSRLRA